MEQLVGTVLLAGELLLTCGAEMYRVEETVERMGKAAGFTQVEIFATPTGMFISLYTPDGRVYSRVRRIRNVHNNLATIASINSLSRSFSVGDVSIEEVQKELDKLQSQDTSGGLKSHLIGGLGSASFTLMYAGSWFEALIAGIVGSIVLIVVSWLEGQPVPKVLQAATGAVVAAGLVTAVADIFQFNFDVVTLGAVMVLAPGVVMTTAIRDMLSGELVSGVSRGAEALAIAVAVATGVAIVLSVGGI